VSSVEKQARRALWAMTAWRFVGDFLSLPRRLIQSVGQFMVDLETTILYLEFHAASRYKLLTGVDLAYATGDARRYSGLDVARAERAQAALFDDDGVE
jgi:hypothetical protein